MRLWGRIAALLGVLAVPLALALASQGLAARPGPPEVPAGDVRLAGPVAGPSGSPAPPPAGVAPGSAGPQIVAPQIRRDSGDDADDSDDSDDD